jgi:CheY-like chemotaxis protein
MEIPAALSEHAANVRSAPPLFSILVVDPDADTRDIYRLCFECAGCTVVEAADGRDGLAKALGREPSLVITEMRMPFIDGVTLCELLRRDSATSGVPILMVTAESQPVQLARATEVGADAVLRKPAPPEDVLHAAMELLRTSQGARPRATTRHTAAPVEQRHTARSKSHARFDTVNPPATPPELTCPACDRPLKYDHSHVGGVSDQHAEQWDYYDCPTCGTFQYRQRTRKVRSIH